MKRLLSVIHKPLRRAAAVVLSTAILAVPLSGGMTSAHAADEQKTTTAKEITLYRWERVKSAGDLNLNAGGSTQVMMIVDGKKETKKESHIASILDLSRASQADSAYGYKASDWEYWQYGSSSNKKVYTSTNRKNSNSHDTVSAFRVDNDKIKGTEVTDKNIDTSRDVFYTDRDYPTMFIKSVGVDFDNSRAVFQGGKITIEPSFRSTTYYDSDNNCYTFALGIGDGSGHDTGWYLNVSRSHPYLAPVSTNTGVYMWEQSSTGNFKGEGQRPWSMKFFGNEVGLFVNVDGHKDSALCDGDYGEINYEWGWSDNDLKKFALYKRTALRMSALDGDLTVKSGAPMQTQNNLYVRSGKTITVEDGAVLTVRGVLYLDGQIKVKKGGTLILQNGACIQPLGRVNGATGESPSDSITLEGGNLILLSGSRLLTGVFGRGLQTSGGASVLNCGTIIQASSARWDGLSLENRANGMLVTGWTIDSSYLVSFYESSVSSSGWFKGSKARWGVSVSLGSDSAAVNEGKLFVAAGTHCTGIG